jgi:hypothetical protein
VAECTDRKDSPKVFARKILSCLREEETKRKIKAAVCWPCALAAPDWAKRRRGNSLKKASSGSSEPGSMFSCHASRKAPFCPVPGGIS